MSYLLDTNVVSELVAARPNPGVTAWLDGVEPDQVFLSVITVGELKGGIDKLPDSKRRRQLSNWLNGDLLVRFGERVLPIDVAVALAWGTLVAQTRAAGTPIPAVDSLLAATAAVHGLTLVTRNTGDFEAAGIALHNPWEQNP